MTKTLLVRFYMIIFTVGSIHIEF